MRELRFMAKVWGAEFEDEKEEKKEQEEKKKSKNLMLFKDPKEYKSLSKEERKDLTKKMKGIHQQKIHMGG